MASLDFAFLAEFAKIEPSATITAVGAGLRGVGVPAAEGAILVYVAGGVDRDRGEGSASLTVSVEAPSQQYNLSQNVRMDPALEVGDFATTVFALATEVPLVDFGKYLIHIAVNEVEVKVLDLWIGRAAGVPTAGD